MDQICERREGQPRPMSRWPAGGVWVIRMSVEGGIGVWFQGGLEGSY